MRELGAGKRPGPVPKWQEQQIGHLSRRTRTARSGFRRIAEHDQGVRRRLDALEQCFVLDADFFEVGDPLVDCLATFDLKRQVVESGAPS